MAEDLVDVVLEHDANGYGFTIVAGEYMFKVGEPTKVPRAFAEQLIAGNPEPWQGKGHNVYRIAVKTSTVEK